jgi:hypothetical protein
MNGPDTGPPIVLSKSSQGDCAAITIKYNFSPCSELNMEQLQIIMVILACVPSIPVEKTLLLPVTVGMMYVHPTSRQSESQQVEVMLTVVS